MFNLAILHTAVALGSDEYPHFIYSHTTVFLGCIATLISLIKHTDGPDEFGTILNALVLYVKNVYSSCVPPSRLTKLIEACLMIEKVLPGVCLSIPGVETEVIVPSEDVMPKLFVEHVKGLKQSRLTDLALRLVTSEKPLRCVLCMFHV